MDISKYARYIDHSPLKMDATESGIIGFCNEAIEYSFYAMVVFPHYIDVAKKALKGGDLKRH